MPLVQARTVIHLGHSELVLVGEQDPLGRLPLSLVHVASKGASPSAPLELFESLRVPGPPVALSPSLLPRVQVEKVARQVEHAGA